MLKDLQYALRMMRNSPAFTAVAVLSLALGIGANTAIFSLIDAVMLRLLPIKDPQQIVLLSDPAARGMSIGITTGDRNLYTYPEFVYLRDHQQVFTDLYAVQSEDERENIAIGGDGQAKEPATVKLASGNYFRAMGLDPAMGRFFTGAEEATPGASPVAVISYEYWKSRFNKSAEVLGKTFRLYRTAFTIIGVAPQGFFGDAVGEAPAIWIPVSMQREAKPGRDFLVQKPGTVEKVMWLRLAGRLRPGVSEKQASAQLNVLFRQVLERDAAGDTSAETRHDIADSRIKLYAGARGASSLRDRFSEPLLVLMSVVGLVLLLACVNMANLLLARSAGRAREIGIRLALGAGRTRLVKQLMTESVLLALAGGALGILFAYWSGNLLLAMAARDDSGIPIDISPNLRLLGFAFAISLLTGLLFGLVPALRATRVDVNPMLKDNSRGVTAGGRGSKWSMGRLLVVVQVALSLVLLIGAGLFARTLSNLSNVQLGYEPDHLLLISVDPSPAGYKGASTVQLFDRLLERVRSIPGVNSASVSENGLFSHSESGDRITVEGYNSSNPRDLNARFDVVGPDYFKTTGIGLLLGREFTRQDATNAPHVCIINETMAKFYFHDSNPIGKHIRDEFPDTRVTFEIAGVVKDAKYLERARDNAAPFLCPILRSDERRDQLRPPDDPHQRRPGLSGGNHPPRDSEHRQHAQHR